ncbi:MAG: 50S ribosomal protein L3 [Candidatus Omnitrophota bacterium]
MLGLLGKKIGMTQIFENTGERVPVTVLEVGPCSVQEIRVKEKNGYNAVQLGFSDAKEKRVKKPQREYLKSKNLKAKRFVREITCPEKTDLKIGDEVKNDIFQKGDYIDVIGITKGKGFQGGIKRHGWAGGKDTHGSMSHRAPGSMGASSFPSRVIKGHPLPGHMGSEKRTIQNLKVLDVDATNNTLVVKGCVPGANGSYLIIKYAKKKTVAPRAQKEQIQEDNTKEGSKE